MRSECACNFVDIRDKDPCRQKMHLQALSASKPDSGKFAPRLLSSPSVLFFCSANRFDGMGQGSCLHDTKTS